MNVLLDTHTFLWFCQNSPSLSKKATTLLEDASYRHFASLARRWEIAIKAGLGRLKLGEPSEVYLANALAQTGFELLSISLEHATGVEQLPRHHKDPFDRLLISQAMAENTPIVSGDSALDAYNIVRLW
ncbi:MAG: type II toxin-antitoxin system VapC family toxin [Pirellulales bacterium]